MSSSSLAPSTLPSDALLTAQFPSISILVSPFTNRGIYATKHIRKGDVVFTDSPAFFRQELANRRDCIVCASCAKFIGELSFMGDVLCRRRTREGALQRELKPGAPPPPPPPGVPCQAACGEWYCSDTCRDMHWKQGGHCLLCVGACKDESHALAQFKMHAVGTCHDELLAAEAMATMVARVAFDGTPFGAVLGVLAPFATAPYHAIVGAGDPAATADALSRNQEGFALLRQGLAERLAAFAPNADAAEMALKTVASYEVFSGLLGIFELNNLAVDCESPVDQLMFALENQLADDATVLSERLGVDAEADRKALVKHLVLMANEAQAARIQDAEGDAVTAAEAVAPGRRFPGLEGTALFALGSCMNHSCSPNVESRYDDIESPATVTVFATRDIAAGEEICHAYIEEEADVRVRRSSLRHYGFTCMCPRCVAESA
ncbi:histone-lysine N-trimethyltransferase SMYD5 [Pycnococcus provasolii]